MRPGIVASKKDPRYFNLWLFAILVGLSVAAVVISAPANQSHLTTAFVCPAPLQLVAPNICDDGVSTAYFSCRNDQYIPDDQMLQQIVGYKKAWEAKFPERRIVTMIRTEQSSAGSSVLTGVLIHYSIESK